MKLQYGKSWFRVKREMTELWAAPKAEKAHLNRLPYAVLIQADQKKECFLEFNNSYIGVGFLDAYGREFLSYQFQEIEPGRLFLSMVTHREFDADLSQIVGGTTYVFKPDGNMIIKKENFNKKLTEVSELNVDISANWDTYPKFGQYVQLIKIERFNPIR